MPAPWTREAVFNLFKHFVWKPRKLKPMDFSHLFSIVTSFRVFHSNNNGSKSATQACKNSSDSTLPGGKNAPSHPQLWPAHPSVPAASLLFSLSNVDPSSQLQRPPPVFLTFIPSLTSCILPAKMSFLRSEGSPSFQGPNLDHYLFHAQPCESCTVNKKLLSSLNC